jgi:ParB family chromosome partitioning protein
MLALVGNLQREDMPPVDEARAFKKLSDMGYTQAEIGARIGKSQTLISMRMRLLEFSQMVQDSINQGRLPCDERVLSNLRKLDISQQESVARAVANRKMVPAAIMGICARISHQKMAPRAKGEEPSDCPPLQWRKLVGEYRAVEPLLRKTCQICGLYAEGGDRKICPRCPVITLAKLMAEK